jgi:NADH-quinone oxidoreductase subunit L
MYATPLLIILLAPFVSFAILGFFGRKYIKNFSGILGTVSLLISLIFSCIVANRYFFVDGMVNGKFVSSVPVDYLWLSFTPELSIHLGFLVDPISVMMLLVVTFVSFLVHVYSLGYMKGEERYATYYSFLSLFTFSMLGLVIASNIFQTYIFWELVGVSSFLLIGFYYNKPSAVAASKKAFIVTRFADLGFLAGILVLSYYSGTLDFTELIARMTDHNSPYVHSAITASFLGLSALTWALVLIFIGGAGKSAMFPLHIWLPDAMEGPTPVSALIHAATMVVAGVYLVARLFPVFALTCPVALDVVAVTGIVSALFAAIIACTQTDIKRVLAYSTMSQIGFMMFALGVSGYYGEEGTGFMGSMFHLFTHAIFKALLFLCAGTVIHFVHSNEITDMGGLRRGMKLTHICFLIACLAISGIPPFSGFFSKEEILKAAYHSGSLIYWTAIVTSGLTAFYMFRLFYSIFYRGGNDQRIAVHYKSEGPFTMILPQILLAAGAIAAGFIPFGNFVSADHSGLDIHTDISFSIIPVLVAITGIIVATFLFASKKDSPFIISEKLGSFYRSAKSKFYIDEIYEFVTKKVLFKMVAGPAAWIDKNIVDGMMNMIARTVQVFSVSTGELQSGKVQLYAVWFLAGVCGLILLLIYFITRAI